MTGPTTPNASTWFRLFPFRSPLLRKSRVISFPPPTKMFQFGGCCFSCPMYSDMDYGGLLRWVPPFGHLRIKTPSGSPKLFAGNTSFFANRCQGIHQQPLFLLNHKDGLFLMSFYSIALYLKILKRPLCKVTLVFFFYTVIFSQS